MCFQVASSARIRDQPRFRYRGLLIDTGRNYFSVSALKRIAAAMGRDKMNVLHWHMNEQHSFPFVSESEPNMAKYGAYSDRSVLCGSHAHSRQYFFFGVFSLHIAGRCTPSPT